MANRNEQSIMNDVINKSDIQLKKELKKSTIPIK